MRYFKKIENFSSAWLASGAFLRTPLATTLLLQNPLPPAVGTLPSDHIFQAFGLYQKRPIENFCFFW